MARNDSRATPEPSNRRRWPLRVFIGTTALVSIAAVGVTYTVILISTGFYAKQLCSEVFVGGRAHEAVVAQDLRNLYPALTMRWMQSRIDRTSQSAVASYFGIAPTRAVHRSGQGCALTFEPVPPATDGAMRNAAMLRTAAAEPARALSKPLPWLPQSEPNPRLQAVIDRAFAEVTDDGELQQRTRGVMILRDGRVLAERYAKGFDADSRFPGWSIGKSVAHALVGMLVRDGRIRLDDPLPIPEWVADERRHITWEHMLRMTSGLAIDETYLNPRSDVNLMLWRTSDVSGFAAQAKAGATPGIDWKYTSGTTNVLMRAVRLKLGPGESHIEFPRRALFDRIGMTDTTLETDATGNFVASSFIYGTVRDYARFGWLYANDGVWQGERILPEGWVAHAAKPTARASNGEVFGAHFWVSVPESERHLYKRVPESLLQAAGFGGQRITILPAERVVIVRVGLAIRAEAWNQWKFLADVLDALDSRSD